MADIWTWDKLAAWYTQHGGERGRKPIAVKVLNPEHRDNGGSSVTVPKTILEQRIELTAGDGSRLTLSSQGIADPNDPTSETWQEVDRIDAKPTTTPAARAGQTGAGQTRVINGRVMQWDPDTKTFDIDLGKAGVGSQSTSSITNVTQDKESGKWYGLQDGQWTEVPGGPGLSQQQKGYTSIRQDPNTGAWFGLTQDNKWEPVQGGPGIAKPAGSVQRDPDTGELVQITTDSQGNAIMRPVQRQGVSSGGPVPPPPEVAAGNIYSTLTKYWNTLQERMNLPADDPNRLTNQQAVNAFSIAHKLADAQMTDLAQKVGAEEKVYSGGITQRGQDVNQADTRASVASSIFNEAVRAGMQASRFTNGAKVMRAILDQSKPYLEALGALNTPAPVSPGSTISSLAGLPAAAQAGAAPTSVPGVTAAPGQPAPVLPGPQLPTTTEGALSSVGLQSSPTDAPAPLSDQGGGTAAPSNQNPILAALQNAPDATGQQPQPPASEQPAAPATATIDLGNGISISLPTGTGSPGQGGAPPSAQDKVASVMQGVQPYLQPSAQNQNGGQSADYDWDSLLANLGFDDKTIAAARAARANRANPAVGSYGVRDPYSNAVYY